MMQISMDRMLGFLIIALTIGISAEIAIQYELDYAVPWSPPNANGLSELSWIRSHFGFFNDKVIVVVRDTSSYLWELAYDGGLVYFGNVFYLLTNQTDYSLLNNTNAVIRNAYIGSTQRLWTYGVLRNPDSRHYTILVPSDIYGPDPIERQVLSPIGGGVYSVKDVSAFQLQRLFSAWLSAHTSGDLINSARPFLTISPLVPCSMFSNWFRISSTERISVTEGFKTAACSLNVSTTVNGEAALYVQLSNQQIWNLQNYSYVGFYFKGTANSSSAHSLTLLLSGDTGFSSYFFYTINDASLWDGNVHGILLPLDSFGIKGNANLRAIESIDVGIYTNNGGTFAYGLESVSYTHLTLPTICSV